MHQALVSPKPKNIAPLPHAGNGKNIHGAASAGIESLRHEAARLRATAQAKMTLAGTCATLHNATDLLQRAAILDRGADVLALTNLT